MKRLMMVTSCLSGMLMLGSSCKQPGEPAADIASAVSAARKAVTCQVDNLKDARLNRAQTQVLIYTISGKGTVSDADACTLVKAVEGGANGGAAANPADNTDATMAAFAQITFDIAASLNEKADYLKGVQTAGAGAECTPLTHVYDQVTMALNKCGSNPSSSSSSSAASSAPASSSSSSASSAPASSSSSAASSAPPAIKYADITARVFKPNGCFGCHGEFKSYASLMDAGVVTAGKPKDSSLYQMLKSKAMPPDSDGVSDDLVKLVGDWITEGAQN